MGDKLITGDTKPVTFRILLVEDDDVSALLLQTILSTSAPNMFLCRRADRLSAAIQEVANGGIDLVLLDLGLPDSGGMDTFLRMRDAAAGVPIIVLTGLNDEALATATVQQGAQDYLIKGQTDKVSLVRAIHYAIERSRALRELAEQHAILRSVIDNIPDQVYLKDLDSRFVVVNPVTARFFGASTPDQLVGKTDFDFFPRELASQFLAEEQALMHHNQPCMNREAAVTDYQGNTQWMLTTKVALRDKTGNIIGLLGINRDISERKKAEEGILLMNAELERRVTERTSELRQAIARLEENDRARTEFVSSVSHELKTPLTSMRYGISNLLDGVAGPLPERIAEYLQLLDMDCRRMTGTVEDILDFTRLESKTMRLHRVKLLFERVIQRGATTLRIQAQAKSIEMVMSLGRGLGFVDCDAFKMARAIINIIGNAIKFTPEGGRVEVSLRRDALAPGRLILDVTDTGIGIPPQHLSRVTEKYFRVGEHVSGTGLGLPIAKEIIELHGGMMSIQSPPPGMNEGTRVSVSLPTTDPPVILIAIDDKPTRDLIEQLLRACGYNVMANACGKDVMDLARSAKPDLVILDVPATGLRETDLVFCMKSGDLRQMPLMGVAGGTPDPASQVILKGLALPILPTPWSEEDLLDCVEAAVRGVSSSAISST